MKIAVLSDLHLQYENPIARNDNYFETAIRKLEYVRKVIGPDTLLIIAGDIFDVGKPRNILKMHGPVSKVLQGTKTIYGNHDISFHQASYLPETAYASIDRVLNTHLSKVTEYRDIEIHPFNFGLEIEHKESKYGLPMVAVSHQFVYQDKQPFDKGVSGIYLLTEYPEYDIIITGDNHQHFIIEYDGRVLINNGSLMRMTSAQKDYQPVVTVWDNGKVETIDIPIDVNAVSDAHTVFSNARLDSKANMLAYMELVKNAQNESYDFTSNLLAKIESLPHTQTRDILMETYNELKEGV